MGGNYLGFVTEVFGRARDKRLCIVEHPIFSCELRDSTSRLFNPSVGRSVGR